jgi:spore coat polysaccharide biosynthesis protein SpsF
MKTAITITARMKSTRLQLKVLRYMKGRPMIEHLIDRLKMSEKADEIIMCTSTNPQDDILVDIADYKKIDCYRGSEDDVLARLYGAVKSRGIDCFASTTADNPLTDPEYMDKIFETFHGTSADYITCKGLPLGAYSYGVRTKALEKVIQLKKENDTEIWGRFFEGSDVFNKIELKVSQEVNYPDLRLTVDEEPDLKLMRIIFDEFYKGSIDFKLKDVVRFLLDNPGLIEINKDVYHWTKKPALRAETRNE